jgi:hypothetical protein
MKINLHKVNYFNMDFQEKFLVDNSNGKYFGSKVDILIIVVLNRLD